MSNNTLIVNCPHCQKPVSWDENSLFRPFCSKRCQLVDLGEWANEEKYIASEDDSNEDDSWSTEQQHL